MKKYKKTLLKIVVSGVLFTILFVNINFITLVTTFKLLNPTYVPLICLLLVTNYLVSAVRWKKLLIYENASTVSTWFLAKLYFIGSFFNNFMPTSIGGDVYKVVRLGKKLGSATNAFSATFMERFTGVIALVLISYLGLVQTLDFWLNLLPTQLLSNALIVGIVKVSIFVGFWVAVFVGFITLNILSKKNATVNKIYLALMSYKSQRSVLFWAFVTSFAVQLLAIFTQYFIFKALGIELPILFSFVVFPIITLASFFIPSLNGIGVQDLLYVQLIGAVIQDSELALAASLLYHLFRLFISLIGGLLYVVEKPEA